MTDSAVYSLTAATIRGNCTLVSYSSLSRSGNPITCLFVLVLQSNEHGCACRCHLTLQWICIRGVTRICAGGISQLTSRWYSVSLSVKQSKLLYGWAPYPVHGVYTVPVLRVPSPYRRSNRGTDCTAVFVRSMYGSVNSCTNIIYFSLKMFTLAILMHYHRFHP